MSSYAQNQSALIGDFLKLRKIAVVGSFRNQTKVAYSVVKHLLALKKYDVFPVNPNVKEVEGIPVYRSITDLPEGIELVDMLTPPEATLKILEQCLKKSIVKVWLQPGASDDRVLAFCRDHNISFVYNACIMVFS